jgi:hypothetical protein
MGFSRHGVIVDYCLAGTDGRVGVGVDMFQPWAAKGQAPGMHLPHIWWLKDLLSSFGCSVLVHWQQDQSVKTPAIVVAFLLNVVC